MSTSRSSLLLLLPLLSACAFTNDFDRYTVAKDDGGADSGQDSGVDAGDGGDDGGVDASLPPLACASAKLVEGVAVDTTTQDAPDAHTTTCGGGGSPDLTFEFVATATTYYRFTTVGSPTDTVLSVLEGSCDPGAAELGCNDNDGALPTSEVIVPLTKDQRVLVVVDGNATQGAVKVLAERIACPANTILASTPITHTTVGRPDDHSSSCGGAGGGDQSYRFVPTTDGFYAIRATKVAANTRTVVTVETGAECGGPQLQCNKGDDGRSEVTRFLKAGVPVSIWVDAVDASTSGTYELVVEPKAAITCGESGMLGTSQVSTTIAQTDAHHFSTSCASTSVWWLGRTDPAQIKNFPDRSYTLLAPAASPGCSFQCTYAISARFPFAAAILDGNTCGGAELACYGAPTQDNTDPQAPVWKQSVKLNSTSGPRERTLVIDRVIYDYQGGAVAWPVADDMQITVQCSGVC